MYFHGTRREAHLLVVKTRYRSTRGRKREKKKGLQVLHIHLERKGVGWGRWKVVSPLVSNLRNSCQRVWKIEHEKQYRFEEERSWLVAMRKNLDSRRGVVIWCYEWSNGRFEYFLERGNFYRFHPRECIGNLSCYNELYYVFFRLVQQNLKKEK